MRSSRYSPYILLSALTLLTYGNALNHSFYLDEVIFVGRGIRSLNGFLPFFYNGFQGIYRPITNIFFKILNMAFQENTVGYHVVNLILFAVVCCLFFNILQRLLKDEKLALLASCLYTVHPINAMFVNYKTGSGVTLYILFMQLSCLAFIQFMAEKRKRDHVFSLIFYFASLLCHEISSILPVILILIAYFFYNVHWKKFLSGVVAYGLILTIYLFVRSQIPGLRPIDTLFHLSISLSAYISTLTWLLYWYVSKLFFPRDVLLVMETPVLINHAWPFVGIFLGAVGACSYVILRNWQRKPVVFCMLLFIVGFLPFGVSGFVYVLLSGTALIEPHWFGFTSIGFFALAAYVIIFLQSKMIFRLWQASVAAIFILLILLTRQNNALWQDEKAYYTYWLSVNPADRTARDGLENLRQQGL